MTSGGLDSATCVALAIEKYGEDNVSTLSVRYGQTLIKEVESARAISDHYNIPHLEIDLTDVFKGARCSLISDSMVEIEEKPYEEQNEEIITSYVPFRNGLFLSAAASLGLSRNGNQECVIVLGNHGSDFSYADCSHEFVKKMNDAISEGTYGLVHFWSPLDGLNKAEVVKEGLRLMVPYELTWSCYEGGDKPCGKCASCQCRIDAFRQNGVDDPITYK